MNVVAKIGLVDLHSLVQAVLQTMISCCLFCSSVFLYVFIVYLYFVFFYFHAA